jgi:hypothetical protein
MSGKWMSTEQRAVRVLAARLAELEGQLEKDPTLWPEYRATLREYRETRAMLAAAVAPISERELARRFQARGPGGGAE